VAAIAIAFTAALIAGISAGLFCALRASADGVRPRRILREHRTVLEPLSAIVTCIALGGAIGGVIGADHLRWALAPTCAAAGLLIAIASWLVLVEPEDDGEIDAWGDPHWWPQFEQDLDDWRRSRIPAGPRA
jgi:hypothetical protein